MTTYASSSVCSVCSSTTSSPALPAVYALMPNAVIPSGRRTGCQESVPSTGRPSMSSIRTVFTKRLQDDGVDRIVTVDALLEIRDARPGVEVCEAETIEPCAHLGEQIALEREPPLARRAPEQAVVERVQALQLVDRSYVVLDPEVDERVRQLSVAAVALDDEERRGLLAAPVAARRLCRDEAVEQALGEAPLRALERLGERVDRLAADEDVPLCRVARPGAMTRPVVALRPGPARRAAVRVDDPELPLVPAVVRGREPFHDLLCAEAVAHEREPVRPVARVRIRLRRDRADVGFRPRHDRADGEEFRLHRHAPLLRVRIVCGDRVRHPYVSLVRSSVSRSLRSAGTTTQDTSGRASAAFTASALPARTTTGRPSAKAARSESTSPTSSTRSAPSTSTSPSAASSGTRLPVAPNQRSLTGRSTPPARSARRSRPARASRARQAFP